MERFDHTTQLAHETQERVPVKDISKLISFFKMGDRVHYFPEYQSDMTLESIILGYEINGHKVYSLNEFELLTTDAGRSFLIIFDQDKEYEYTEIDSFCIIVPGKAGEEYQLSYPDKAALGARGQFRNGNAITLIARNKNNGAIRIETCVRESFIEKESYYRGHQLALLEVIATSLEFSEQRTQQRIKTNVPVQVTSGSAGTAHEATMTDYSEVNLCINFDPSSPLNNQLKLKGQARVHIQPPEELKEYTIVGQILRKQPDQAVITIQEIETNGVMRPFQLMDALDIKACLLQLQQSH